MKNWRESSRIDRREFLTATGTGLLAATLPSVAKGANVSEGSRVESSSAVTSSAQASGNSLRKIPIGVFDPVYDKLSLDEMLDKVSALGLEAMEIGTGGYPGSHHCPVDELVKDPAKAHAWKKKFEDHNLRVATLS